MPALPPSLSGPGPGSDSGSDSDDGPRARYALSTPQFEAALLRLAAKGHAVPEMATYARGQPWQGTCTRCGAVAEALPPEPRRSHKKRLAAARHDQKAAPRPYGRVDVRLLWPCRGASGTDGPPPPGRPFGGR